MNKIILNLQIACKIKKGLPSKKKLKIWLKAVLPKSKLKNEITIRITDKTECHYLNLLYSGKNAPTNVLSFPFKIQYKIKTCLLGDLIICQQIVAQEAFEQKKKYEEHLAHIIVHGCLHLLGFNHIKNNEAKKMERLETKIITGLGYSDPYILID
ncbi:Endoribonuclease YbeY [Candidatus Providencia siddallii]|uniref:Endoribonuclease YbeY n=1 Tax=Candidatus Providencia siddallii TaxID=1715285 RepID=A0A0M6WAI4_9GAMM|nr:Endoribonuclease YbeY [Candidatus Providencia siddallii]